MLVAAAASLGPAPAQAQVPAFKELETAVRIEAGATCLTQQALIQHVASWLGTTQVDAQLSVIVHGSAHSGRVVWFGIERAGALVSERRFEPGPSPCEELHAAVGLAIALGIKVSLLESFVPTPAIADTGRVFEPPRWAAGIDVLASQSVVPGLALGASLELQRALAGSLSARLGLIGITGPERAFAPNIGQFDIWLLSSRLNICNAFRLSQRLQLSACLGLALGRYEVRGRALSPGRTGHARFLAVANALDLTFDLNTAWSVHMAIHALFPLERTSVVVLDAGGAVADANELDSVGGFLSLGPKLRF